MSKFVYYCLRCREYGVAEHENTEEKQNCRCGAETLCTGYTLEEWNALPPSEKDRVTAALTAERPAVRSGPYDGSMPAFSKPAPAQPARPIFAQNATKAEPAAPASAAAMNAAGKRRFCLLRVILFIAGLLMLLSLLLEDITYLSGHGVDTDSLSGICSLLDTLLLNQRLFWSLVLFALSAVVKPAR